MRHVRSSWLAPHMHKTSVSLTLQFTLKSVGVYRCSASFFALLLKISKPVSCVARQLRDIGRVCSRFVIRRRSYSFQALTKPDTFGHPRIYVDGRLKATYYCGGPTAKRESPVRPVPTLRQMVPVPSSWRICIHHDVAGTGLGGLRVG